MNKKSILTETLEQIKEIRDGLEQNANQVLKSTLKEDLEDIVSKGLQEIEDFEDDDDENKDDHGFPTDDMAGETTPADQPAELGIDDETPGLDSELPSDITHDGEPDVIDLTDKTDDEVIKQFNLMDPADEIEIVKTADGITINIKSKSGGEEMPGEENPMDDLSGEETPIDDFSSEEDETKLAECGDNKEEMVYEIEISEDNVPQTLPRAIELGGNPAKDGTPYDKVAPKTMNQSTGSASDPKKQGDPYEKAAPKGMNQSTGSASDPKKQGDPYGDKSIVAEDNVSNTPPVGMGMGTQHVKGMEKGIAYEKASSVPGSLSEKEEVKDEEGTLDETAPLPNRQSVQHMRQSETNKDQEQELREGLIKTRKKLSTLVTENKTKTEELDKVYGMVHEFKNSEKDYKATVKALKTQLQEVALFTSNLTYAVKLMTENTTTKDEKLNILKRFDAAKTLTESREIYNSLHTTLNENKQSAEKIIENKVLDAAKGSGASKLNEATAYKNPQHARMLEIISKI